MTKIIAITGATGTQGGGVANVLLKTPGWKVRAITRNTNSDKAKDLASRGAEVVQANYDDENSLAAAFEGVHAIFAVTNFWEFLFTGKSQSESGDLEKEQGIKLAKAASRTPTLEHYIWSTLPDAKKLTNGKAPVPHFDYKAEVDIYIKKELPELAKKTTFFMVAFYPQNVAFFPMLKPIEYPGSYGKSIWPIPSPAKSPMPISGDMTQTTGIYIRQILSQPSLTHSKYVFQATETKTLAELLKDWTEVTGRPAVYLEIGKDAYEEIWGIGGKELVDQFAFGEVVEDWGEHVGALGWKDLGIEKGDAPGFKESIVKLKTLL